jgi:hypothetical protein
MKKLTELTEQQKKAIEYVIESIKYGIAWGDDEYAEDLRKIIFGFVFDVLTGGEIHDELVYEISENEDIISYDEEGNLIYSEELKKILKLK